MFGSEIRLLLHDLLSLLYQVRLFSVCRYIGRPLLLLNRFPLSGCRYLALHLRHHALQLLYKTYFWSGFSSFFSRRSIILSFYHGRGGIMHRTSISSSSPESSLPHALKYPFAPTTPRVRIASDMVPYASGLSSSPSSK